MRFCPLCKEGLRRSNLVDVYACGGCGLVFNLKQVTFEKVQAPPTPPPKKENPVKDLTSIPNKRKVVVEEPEELEGEVIDE